MAVTKTILVLILAILCIGRQQVVLSACSIDWPEYNGYCYVLYNQHTNWFDAQRICRSLGGDIVSIHSPEEYDFIKPMVEYDKIWIGLNRLENGVYKWIDNTPLVYVTFGTWYLDTRNEPCVVMTPNGPWKPKNCREDYSFMCKKRYEDSVSTPTPTRKAVKVEGCPPNFDSVPGASQCYYVGGKNSSEYKSFTEAIDACQALQPGATLASIHSGIDQRFVITLLDGVHSDTLIGLNDQNSTHGEFFSEWVDKTKVNKLYWSEFQPDPYHAQEVKSGSKCVYMEKMIHTAGRWSLGPCDVRRPYVCGHPKDLKFPVKIRHNKGCATGFQKFRNSCYKFFKDNRTWSDAEATCIKQNGHIVSLHDKYETAFIELLIDNVNQAWIGLSYKKANEEYGWSDGWPIIFTDWRSKKVYPNMCVIDIFDEGWQTVSCDTKLPFVCEIDYDPIPPTTTVTVKCPKGWIPFQEDCYQVETSFSKTWHHAAALCSGKGTLTSIHSPDESAFINKWLTLIGSDAWIGLDRGRSGSSFWLDLSALDYIDWAGMAENLPWEIKMLGEKKKLKKYCVAASHIHNSKWVKSDCMKIKPFICKLRQDLLIKVTSQPFTPTTASVTPKHTSHSTHTAPSVTHTSVGHSTHSSLSVSPKTIGHSSSQPPVSTSNSHITNTVTSTTVSACSEDWSEYNGYCYILYSHHTNWFDAHSVCSHIDGDIVTIHDLKENDFIKTMLEYESIWIGLNRLENGVYKWSDNTLLSYVYFGAWYLDNLNELCVAMVYEGPWKPKKCRENYSFMCKKRSNNSVSTPTPTTKAVKVEGCPSNFDSVPGASQCYHVGGKNSSKYKNFTEAIDACQAHQPGATLASIHSGIDQRFVITLLDGVHSDTLIGLNDQNSGTGEFLSGWMDKTEVNKVYWSEFQPYPYYYQKVKSRSKCVYMEKKVQTAGRWSLGPCNVRRPYVCGHPKVRSLCSFRMLKILRRKHPKFPVKIGHNKGCPTGYQKFRNSCYKFFKDNRTWSDAEATCVNQNGHIVSLHDKYETAFIELLIDNVNQAWIGLSYNKANEEYGWSDGWPIIFTDWGSNKVYPNMCAIDIFDEGWQTVSCDTKLPFVCEIDYDPIPPTTTVTVKCPDGWILFQKNCYQLETSVTLSWRDAAVRCTPMGILTSIHSPEESAFINKWLTLIGSDAWIGLDRGRAGNAFWLDLSPLDYIDWGIKIENHPWDIHDDMKHFSLVEYCVEASHLHDGKWVKTDCLKIKNFICKLRQDLLIKVTSQPSFPTTASVTPKHTSHYTHTTPSVTHTSVGHPTHSSSSVSPKKVDHSSSQPPVSTSSSHITNTVTSTTVSACLKDWAEYNGYCYTAYNHNTHWYDAQSVCRSIDGDIVTIHSPGENEFIKTMLGIQNAWIGLNRLENGMYKWGDNTPLSYVNFATWNLNDPNEPCVVILPNGQWEPKSCRENYSFICKKRSNNPVTTPTTTTKAVTGEGCPANFDSVPAASQCYYVGGKNSSEYKNFTEAIDACQALQPGATLASIHSGIDQRFVITLLDGAHSDILIGLNDQNSAYYGEFLSEWVDKTDVNKLYWNKYQPHLHYAHRINSRSKCVYMEKKGQTAGRWSLGPCAVRRPYVCGHPKDPKFPVKIRYNKGCPTGFQKFRNSCYKFFTDNRTWSDAEATCVKQSGHIVSLHDKYETAFIELLIDNVNQAWIGLSYKKANEEYGWSDGWPIIFTDWGSNKVYPNMCAIDMFDEGWQTVSCDTKLPFVCEIDYDPIPPTTTVTVKCPNGWIRFQENCYLLETSFSKPWREAAAHCLPMGILTSLHSPDESAFINKWLSLIGSDAWIGLDRGRSGNAFWLDLSPLDYIDWDSKAENQPWEIHDEKKHFLLIEYCVAASHIHNGKWEKSECLKHKHFICKLRQDLLIKVTTQPSVPPTASVTPSHTGPSTHTTPSVTHTSVGHPTHSSSSVSPKTVGHPSSQPPVSTISTHVTSATPKNTGHSTHATPSAGLLTSSPRSVSQQTVSHITNTAASKTENNGSRLSAGDEAGIALGTMAFVALVVVLAVFTRKYYLKRQRNKDPEDSSFHSLTYFNGNDSSM